MARFTYLAAFLMLLPLALAASKSSLIGLSAPLFVWSNTASESKLSKVSYEVISNLNDVTSSLVLSAAGKQQAEEGLSQFLIKSDDGVVVLFLGSQLDNADLRKSSSAVASLKGMLEGASSSLVFPYAASKSSIRDTVVQSLDSSDVKYKTVNCGADATEADLAAALTEALAAKPKVLVVCPALDSQLDGTEASLEAELRQLASVQKAVSAVEHVVVYSSASAAPQLVSSDNRRRSLLSDITGFGSYTSCGKLCQVQVRWLEGLLGVLFLAIAASSGLVCLYVLDTPTRFQTAKESS